MHIKPVDEPAPPLRTEMPTQNNGVRRQAVMLTTRS